MYPWLEAVNDEFAERLREDRLPHGILISGPGYTGKTALAKEFIASVLCLENRHPACGTCRSCQLLETGAHPDRQTITFEEHPKKAGEFRKELVIGQVRNLIVSLSLTNTISRRKAALIYPLEAMNRSAANALLKTLEEPPGDTVLILVANDVHRLPATIRSRCQNLLVRTPDSRGSIEWLCQETAASREQGEAALLAAAGSPLKAARLIQEGSFEHFRKVTSALTDLRSRQSAPDDVIGALAEIDPDLLWSWISLFAAEQLKNEISRPEAARELSRLQSEADRNRKLLPTPVRKDFLLQDWLIQWSRIRA